MRDGVANLVIKAFTSTHVQNYPPIHSDHVIQSVEAQPVSNLKVSPTTLNYPPKDMDDYGKKGELIIWDLWKNGTNSIDDMWILSYGAYLYLQSSPKKVIQGEKSRKGNLVLRYGF